MHHARRRGTTSSCLKVTLCPSTPKSWKSMVPTQQQSWWRTKSCLCSETQHCTDSNNKHSSKERDYYNLWPKRVKDVTVIPYEFSKGVFNHAEQSVITKAMQDLARQVRVVRFVPRSSVASKKKNRNYLQFTADEIHRDGVVSSDDIDCWSHVGWQGEDGTSHNNVINLGEDFCISTGPVWHLLLHTLGMWHTPSRWDRDDYVTVVWENIIPGREYNFRKRIHDDTTCWGFRTLITARL